MTTPPIAAHAMPLHALTPWAHRPVDQLVRDHAFAFLVVVGKLEAAAGPMRTMVARAQGEETSDLTTWVFPLRRRPESPHPFISIGRIPGNDVVLDDVTVSKFHAFAKEVDGVVVLQDAGSRNGTFVDELPVAARRAGPPTPLRTGQSVRFGNVHCNFLGAAGLHALLHRLGMRRLERPRGV